jgi:hypothetical protein
MKKVFQSCTPILFFLFSYFALSFFSLLVLAVLDFRSGRLGTNERLKGMPASWVTGEVGRRKAGGRRSAQMVSTVALQPPILVCPAAQREQAESVELRHT